jgi:hemoglobin
MDEEELPISSDPTLAAVESKPVNWPVSGCFSGSGLHPMQLLQQRATELSGVSYQDANEIDSINLGEIIGEYNMLQLSESFYKKVLNDKDEWFRNMFSGREDFASDQNEFIMQRMGGPSYYSDRKGTPGLIKRHAHIEMSPRTAERWLEYMDETLEEFEINKDISARQREMMMSYFRWQSYFLVASQEASYQMSEEGPSPPNLDKPGLSCPYPVYSQLSHPEQLSETEQEAVSLLAAAEAVMDAAAEAVMGGNEVEG